MSANISPVDNPSVATVAKGSGSSVPTSAAAAAAGSTATSSTIITSLADLRNKAPQVYNLMLVSLATTICQEMEHRQAELKKLMREGQRQC